jgi:hypothetical protein
MKKYCLIFSLSLGIMAALISTNYLESKSDSIFTPEMSLTTLIKTARAQTEETCEGGICYIEFVCDAYTSICCTGDVYCQSAPRFVDCDGEKEYCPPIYS